MKKTKRTKKKRIKSLTKKKKRSIFSQPISKIFLYKNKIPYFEEIINLLVLLLIWWFLTGYFKPDLILADKTTTGGDMVGYYYMAHYMHHYLLSHGKIIGWSHGWFAGFPMFQFYFPLVFLISGLLGYLIPLHISFKLITILGIYLLPLSAFLSLRFMNFKFPIPIVGGIIMLPYLCLEHYSMWGGNIPSTLAGEFSYMLSIALMVLFFGLLWKGIQEKKYLVVNGILFSFIILSHGITTVFSISASIFFLLFVKSRSEFFENFKYLFKTYLLSFLLAGFYFFPMIVKSKYSIPHYWLLIESIPEILNKMIFPHSMYIFYALGIFGIYIGLKNRESRINFFTFSLMLGYIYFFISTPLATSGLPFLSNLLSHFMVVKFLPYIYLLLFLLSISGFYPITKRLKGKFLIPFIVFFGVWIYLNSTVTFIPTWIQWNYSGFEAKPSWSSFQKVNKFLNSAPTSGRVEFEYEDKKHNSGLGSSRAMEALPVFSRPTLIGTQFQGGVNNPSIYSMECEYSKTCPCPLFLLTDGCLPYNLENAKKHLKLFNVKYLIATTQEFKQTLRKDPEFELVYGPDVFDVYELTNHNGNYVVLPEYEPVLIKTKNWRKLSYEWFKEIDKVDVPVVFSEKISDDERRYFKYIIEDFDGDFSKIPKVNLTEKENCYVEEEVKNEEVNIQTTCINKPLWIKISYFPNWKVEGAKKVYMASPTFMLIFPEKKEVKLYYGRTLVDWFGIICSYIGVLIVAIYVFPPLRRRIKID
jgi:hypothetical protein